MLVTNTSGLSSYAMERLLWFCTVATRGSEGWNFKYYVAYMSILASSSKRQQVGRYVCQNCIP